MHYATYSPEDNKLRLYVGRVPRDDYERLRAAGFVSTPKQSCDFVATWTPQREDLARDFIPDDADIDDEDYSPLERSADRAERFEGYRDKRTGEALSSADTFEAGPGAFGHQNERRAERQAARHDRKRTYAVSQWSKAEYWQVRTAGVISHALYRSSASVRRGRILTLEAEQRKHEKARDEYSTRYQGWQKVLTMEGNDEPYTEGTTSKAGRFAYALANSGHCWGEYTHPRTGETKLSMYSLLATSSDHPITPREAAELWLADRLPPDHMGSNSARWSAHYELRLTYERAMLAQEGGSAAAADMEPGGWICTGNRTGSVFTDVEKGWKQIQSVNKSPATGRVTSVKVWGTTTGYTAESEYKKRETKPCLVSVNIERLPEGAYRAPTEEERTAFAVATKERKAKEKAAKPKEPPLINPTDDDAAKLQALWNEKAVADHKRRKAYGECPLSDVRRMTQAEYSARSKGYSSCQASDISERLDIRENYVTRSTGGRVTVFKVRTCHGQNYGARCVIVLTDKPQKPLPWNDVARERAKQPTEATVFTTFGELVEAMHGNDYGFHHNARLVKLLDDAAYVGWAYSSSTTQRGLTEAGQEAYKRFKAIQADGGEPTETGTIYNGAACAKARAS